MMFQATALIFMEPDLSNTITDSVFEMCHVKTKLKCHNDYGIKSGCFAAQPLCPSAKATLVFDRFSV